MFDGSRLEEVLNRYDPPHAGRGGDVHCRCVTCDEWRGDPRRTRFTRGQRQFGRSLPRRVVACWRTGDLGKAYRRPVVGRGRFQRPCAPRGAPVIVWNEGVGYRMTSKRWLVTLSGARERKNTNELFLR